MSIPGREREDHGAQHAQTPVCATVGAAMAQARGLGVARLDAQLLLARVLQQARSWLIAHDEAALSAAQYTAFMAGCRRCAEGEPMAYLLGEREFYGLMLRVTPAVLVPRPDTETLVDWALELLRGELAKEPVARVADLGTGSGAVAVALKHGHPNASVCAVDISAAAIEVARANASLHRLAVEFRVGDWWQPLQGQRFHLVVGNPPYVAVDDPHMAGLRHEPAQALTSGADGLSAIRQIVRQAPQHLMPGGWLLLEHGHEQSEAVRDCLGEAGFVALQTRTDLALRPRCSGGRLRNLVARQGLG
jgi:release factor glutamine methyltransferase